MTDASNVNLIWFHSLSCPDLPFLAFADQSMSSPYLLMNLLVLGNQQRLDCRMKVCTTFREEKYDDRGAMDKELSDEIDSAPPEKKAALIQLRQVEYDLRMVIIGRYNRVYAELRAGKTSENNPTLQQIAHVSPAEEHSEEDHNLFLDEIEQAEPALSIASPWPPGVSIRSTPRRPGAPAGLLPH